MNKEAIPLAIRRHNLVATVRSTLGDTDAVVGVSGGADSIALLLLCCSAAMQESAQFKIVAAHINHGLRPEADKEQQLVEQLCAQIGIHCVVKHVQVIPINSSIAAGARKVRYKALEEVASDADINTVAVAHHAEDQLETMLMALCRGGGLRKLSGMASVRPLTSQIALYRPLLHVEKRELISICELAKVSWCEDPSNKNPSTPRGRLRNDVIPIIRELWPAADKHASNASTILHAAADSFESSVALGTEWERTELTELPSPVISATLQKAVGDCATFEIIQSITSAVEDTSTHPRTFQLSKACRVEVTAHSVSVIHS
tara:strand:- start:421 stop:1374 length:954 start_codon:yes stop_codon:yes gene_type:complete